MGTGSIGGADFLEPGLLARAGVGRFAGRFRDRRDVIEDGVLRCI
jgi:hypothetical protein